MRAMGGRMRMMMGMMGGIAAWRPMGRGPMDHGPMGDAARPPPPPQ